MTTSERGHVLILALTLLALGTAVTVPSLQLGYTALKSKQIQTSQLKEQYSRDGGAEYALWEVLYGGATSSLTLSAPEANYQITLNGITPNITIKMRAIPETGGLPLGANHKIRPTKTVSPSTGTVNAFTTYTYTITLEQISEDVSDGLSELYDHLPRDFNYVPFSTSWDPGEWGLAPFEPDINSNNAIELLTWTFTPNIFFAEREKKTLSFQATATKGTGTYCNEIIIKLDHTVTVPIAPITVGAPGNPGCNLRKIMVAKTSDPEVIALNQLTTVAYTISLTNNETFTQRIDEIEDLLPAGFTYISGSSSGLTTNNPIIDDPASSLTPGADGREVLTWGGVFTFAGLSTTTLTFQALVTPVETGSLYNEVFLRNEDVGVPPLLLGVGISADDYFTTYSWDTAAVIVPDYDVRSEANTTIGQGNVGLSATSVELRSWHVDSK